MVLEFRYPFSSSLYRSLQFAPPVGTFDHRFAACLSPPKKWFPFTWSCIFNAWNKFFRKISSQMVLSWWFTIGRMRKRNPPQLKQIQVFPRKCENHQKLGYITRWPLFFLVALNFPFFITKALQSASHVTVAFGLGASTALGFCTKAVTVTPPTPGHEKNPGSLTFPLKYWLFNDRILISWVYEMIPKKTCVGFVIPKKYPKQRLGPFFHCSNMQLPPRSRFSLRNLILTEAFFFLICLGKAQQNQQPIILGQLIMSCQLYKCPTTSRDWGRVQMFVFNLSSLSS